MDANSEIRLLSGALHLADEPQDWGITNADPARAEEFINYATRTQLTQSQQYAIVELVLASVNEAMNDIRFTKEMQSSFLAFLNSPLHGLSDQLRYWARLNDSEEFPLAVFLKKHNVGR